MKFSIESLECHFLKSMLIKFNKLLFKFNLYDLK